MGHIADGVLGIDLPVQDGLNLQLEHIGHLVGRDQLGAKGKEGGEVFDDAQVAGVALDVVVALEDGFLGHVQNGGVAHNGVLPVFLGNVPAILAQNHSQLRLGGGLLGLFQGRSLDLISRADQRVGHLEKAAGETLGRGGADVSGMVHIVQADAEDSLGVAVQRGINALVVGHSLHFLQLGLAAGVVPLGQGGNLLGLDQGHHVGFIGGVFDPVDGVDQHQTLFRLDAGHFGVVPLNCSETHSAFLLKL